MNPQEAAFVAAINADPADFATRLVYADWLEEEGRTIEAAGHRWLSEQGKVPGEWQAWDGVEYWFDASDYHDGKPGLLPLIRGRGWLYPPHRTPSKTICLAAETVGKLLADGIDLNSRDELADTDAYYAQLREMEPA